MGLLDNLSKTLDIWLPDEKQVNYGKGVDFERHVVKLFNTKYYAVKEWTRDNSDKRAGITVESDKNPDFVIRYLPKNEPFAVECKYRSSLMWNQKAHGLACNWAYPAQINRYREFSQTTGMPLFVVIGLAGTPSSPDRMFCVPLDIAKYPAIFETVLQKYERPPNKQFFYRDGTLT